ncbi:hypothetical protein ACROYT_G014127 [Oculina patagonica]
MLAKIETVEGSITPFKSLEKVTDQGRTKRKAELVELAVKAREIKLQRIDEDDDDISDVIAGKLRRGHTRLENIQNWSYDISKMPPFTFADLYMYLIGSGESLTLPRTSSRLSRYLATSYFLMAMFKIA